MINKNCIFKPKTTRVCLEKNKFKNYVRTEKKNESKLKLLSPKIYRNKGYETN